MDIPENKTIVGDAPKGGGKMKLTLVVVLFGLVAMFAYAKWSDSRNNESLSQTPADTALEEVTIKKGNEVDSALQQQVIEAFLRQKALFSSGDLAAIREYFMKSTAPEGRDAIAAQMASTSDEGLKKMLVAYNKVISIITSDTLRDPETVWTINKAEDRVRIQKTVPAGNPDGISEITIDMIKSEDGMWY